MSRPVFLGGIKYPRGRYKEIIDYVLKPNPEVKSVDLCCGLGFGKTLLAIQIAVLTLDSEPNHIGMFLEPDWDRVDNIFMPLWEKYVPPELYEFRLGKCRIDWHNGSRLIYRARVITGSKERARSKNRGIPTSFVIDDESALGFDLEWYQNTFARIREKAKIRYFLTLTTPLVGPYGRFLKRGGNKVFHGRTRDNHYLLQRDPTYEARQRALMSHEQARRELDGELVALEGRIWKNCDLTKAWPNGNINHQWTTFRQGEPWWLLIDIGSASGAFAVMQQTTGHYNGRRLYNGPHWIAVAELCPDMDASAASAFQILDDNFGPPVAVSGGADINKRSDTDGTTVSYFVQQIWGNNVLIYPCNESIYNKQVQHNKLLFLMCCVYNFRRFSIARDYIVLDTRSKRGIKEMVDEDVWPGKDDRLPTEYFPKGKEVHVQHMRDALLMGSATIMAPPKWTKSNNRAK